MSDPVTVQLKHLMLKANIGTQKELAKRCGVTPQTVYHMFAGNRKYRRGHHRSTFEKIAVALQLTPKELEELVSGHGNQGRAND